MRFEATCLTDAFSNAAIMEVMSRVTNAKHIAVMDAISIDSHCTGLTPLSWDIWIHRYLLTATEPTHQRKAPGQSEELADNKSK